MTDIKFNVIKEELKSSIKKIKAHWVIMSPEKTKPSFHFDKISSKWVSEIDPSEYFAMREWCIENLEHGTWCSGVYYIQLSREEDVSWFLLRWS